MRRKSPPAQAELRRLYQVGANDAAAVAEAIILSARVAVVKSVVPMDSACGIAADDGPADERRARTWRH